MSVTVHTLKVSRLLLKNYNYLIVDDHSRDAVLIDPAWELDTLENAIKEHQAVLTAVLVTHSHFDHANLCGTLAKRWRVPAFMNRIEIDYYNYHCDGLTPIDSEEPFYCGTLRVMPHFTPGHTKGGICYQLEDALFTGDTLFIEGCGICSGRGADPYAMFDSLQTLKRRLPETTRIFPGHSFGQPCGKPFSFLLTDNIYLQFERADPFVAFRMRKHQDKAKWFRFQ